MSSDIESWPPPDDANAFESLCLDIWKEIWNDPGAQKNGRSGQPQAGVDVFGLSKGKQIGLQCKKKDNLLRSELTVAELEHEVQEAKKFRPPLSSFIVATTGPRDARVQERARLLTDEYKIKGLFSVEVWSWKDIWHEIYQHEELLNRIGPIYWPQSHRLAIRRTSSQSRLILLSMLTLLLIVVVVYFRTMPHRKSGPPASALTVPAVSNSVSLPLIRIETLEGLPEGMTNDPNIRFNRLFVRNIGEFDINNLCSRLQLPEAIVSILQTNVSAGTLFGWRPLLDRLSVSGTGGRTEGGLWIGPTSAVHFVETTPCFYYPGKARGQLGTVSRAGDFTGVWELTFDKLPPKGMVDILFLTSIAGRGSNYAGFCSVPLWASPPNPQSVPDTNEMRFFLEGEYRFQTDGNIAKQAFFVPIQFDSLQRRFSSLPTQHDISQWHPVTLLFQ